MTLRLALIASLLANAVLGAVFMLYRPAPVSPPGGIAVTASPATAPAVDDPLAGINPQTWRLLASTGLPELVTQLRAAGYPPEVIRAIVTERVRERFADRYREVATRIRAQPYWLGRYGPGMRPLNRAREQLEREVEAAVTAALGSPLERYSESERRNLRRVYGDVSPEKLSRLLTLRDDYEQMRHQVQEASHGVMMPDEREQLSLLEREQRADLARILSPEELLAYDLHSSPTAARLRGDLSAFRPTEAEFRTLFELRTQIDAQYPPRSAMTSEQKTAYEAALTQLGPQIANVLGPERYAEYQRQTEPEWRSNDDFVTRYHLPPEATQQLYAIQKDLQKRAAAIRAQSLPPEQANAQLAALADEATVRLTPVLGNVMLEGYRYRNGWLSGLTPKKTEGEGSR